MAEAIPPAGRGRRRLASILSDLHYRLRTEGDTPGRHAAAVALGILIGCVPLYGAHLVLCAALARLFRVNRLVTYMSSNINNPLTAPLLLGMEFGLGHRIAQGRWPRLRANELASLWPWGLGRDLLVGSLVLGVALGAAFGAGAFIVSRRARRSPRWNRLIEETARRYLACGIFHWEFVRCKLRHDRLYRALWFRLESHSAGSLLDLGCGRGIALALADAWGRAPESTRRGAPPALLGVEVRPALAQVARRALGDSARIETIDLAGYDPPAADLVLVLDVLHYMDAMSQERLIERAAHAVRPGGLLLLREPDASMGPRYWLTRALESACALARGEVRPRFHYRPAADWIRLLTAHGLAATPCPPWPGSSFANVLIEAHKPVAAADPPASPQGRERPPTARDAGEAA